MMLRLFAKVTFVLLLIGTVLPGAASAQFETLPRIGLSASATAYVDTIEADLGVPFTLYACVFGHDDKSPIGESLSRLSWVIHQVCCGAAMDILNVEFNPELEHQGHPLSGIQSLVPGDGCLDRESLLLATISVRITAPEPGEFLWASGPAGAIVNCEGDTPWFQGLPVLIRAGGEIVDNDFQSWGSLKAQYR